jgi:hypothetical protein
LFQIALFSRVEETNAYVERKPSVLEARASSAYFHVSFERSTSCKLRVSRCRWGLFVSNWKIQHSWRNTSFTHTIEICVRSRRM